ncbi:MAG: hypothetical protein NC303_05645 [Firmicutes bacterium]|nr:hypothetical protein [Bacillota bacterium]MCM1393938.1 hypothetical protein [[Eubacterium] siraeum]
MFGKRARKKAEQEALRKMMEEAEANRRAAQEAEYAAERESKVFYESEIIFDDDIDDNFFDYQYEDMPEAEEISEATAPTAPSVNTVAALPVPDENKEPVAQDSDEIKDEPVEALDGTVEEAAEPVQEAEQPLQQEEIVGESEVVVEEIPQEVVQEQEIEQEVVQDTVQEQDIVQVAAQEPTLDDDIQQPVPEQEQPVQEQPEQVIEDAPLQPTREEPQAVNPAQSYAEEATAEPEIRYIVDGPVEDEELVKPAKLVKLPNLIDYMLSLNMSRRMKISVATLLIGAYDRFKHIPEEKEIVLGCMRKVMTALMS